MTGYANVRQEASGGVAAMLAVLDRKNATTGRRPDAAAISAAGVVHDLGNLIQVASSVINIIARSPDMPSADRTPLLGRAEASLESAGALVRQTIRIMREGTSTFREASVPDCLADIAAMIGMWEYDVSFEVEADLPKVRCNPLALQNAVLNLVFNARDALAGNGTISISAQTISHGTVPVGVELRIADNGIGMASETLACAFDPFFTTKNNGLGGVGLPMVERFVRETSGEISIESKPGVGTTVAMRLPTTTPSNIQRALPIIED